MLKVGLAVKCIVFSGGVVLLLLCGLPLGNFLGGVFGLKMAGAVSGYPLETRPFPRIMVLGGMAMGLMLTAGSFLLFAEATVRLLRGAALYASKSVVSRVGDRRTRNNQP